MGIDKNKYKNRDRRTQSLIWLFEYDHLDPQLQPISKILCDAAEQLTQLVPDNPHTEFALLWLLTAKDAFVRAAIGGALPPNIASSGLP